MRLLLPLLLLFHLGSAQAALFDDKEARRGVTEAKQQLTELQAKLTELQTQLAEANTARQALEKRLTETEAFGKKQTFDQLAQIERLNAEISRLRGLLELNAHNVALAQQRQRDLYGDLDARLRKIESTGTPPPPADAAAPAIDSAAELRSYEAAHELFKTANYKESAEAFEKFLTDYPAGKYAPNAQYWLGYAYFSQKNYKAAMASQQKLLSVYPDHQKAPDAMYNIANSQIQLADVEGAKKTLRALLEKFPQSEAAPLARKRLAVLDSIKSK